MKKLSLLILLIVLLAPINFGPLMASVNSTVTTVSKIADVTGIVALKVQRKKFPENLVDLFTGSDSKLKKQKKIKVTGTYDGGSVINLSSVAKEGEESEYSFEIPVLSSVLSTSTSKLIKEVSRFQSVEMIFSNTNELPDLVDQASNKFEAGKITNRRISQKGAIVGSFKEAGAKGRFMLKLDFNVED